MTKLLFFYILLFCSFPAFGETILLRGKIVDQKKNPVGSAYVEVQNDNSQIIGYTLSDTLGFFTMALPPKPEYQVNITHVAFNPLSKKVVPSEKEHLFVMDERVENIDEVVVTSSYTKAMRMNSEGNIVFAPKTLGNLVTYNLPRLLQILPSIQITSSGITQNGRPTALLVNGHKRNLSGKSIEAFLRAIPTDKVKEIVITPISSAGDLASENGSINIILKKEENMLATQIGSELNIRKGGVYGNGNAFLMYNKNNFYMDLSLGYYNIYDRKDTKEESTYANSSATSLFDYKTNSREDDYFGSLNLEWETKQGHKLFGAVTGFYDNGTTHADNLMAFKPDEKRQEQTKGIASQDFDDDLYTVEMEFASNDTLRHQHIIGYGIIWGKAHNTGFNNESTTGGEIESELQHNTINRHYGYQHQMKYNYKFLLNPGSTLKAGVHVALGNIHPQSQFIEKDLTAEDFLYADRYNMHENTYGGFVEYAYKHENTSVSAGLRLEYTDYSARSQVDNKKYDYNRMDYFPFFSIYQKVGSIADVSLRLASGIDRPHFLDYVPNYKYTSKYAYSVGNPDLKPSRFYSATLGSMFLDFLYLEFIYMHTKDIISKISKNEENSFQVATTNLNSSDENRFIFRMNCPYVFLNDRLSGYLGTWFGYGKYTNTKVDLGEYYIQTIKAFI